LCDLFWSDFDLAVAGLTAISVSRLVIGANIFCEYSLQTLNGITVGSLGRCCDHPDLVYHLSEEIDTGQQWDSLSLENDQ